LPIVPIVLYLLRECFLAIARSHASKAYRFLAANCVETYLRLEPDEETAFETLLSDEMHMKPWEVQ
jgi:hypothetical protein